MPHALRIIPIVSRPFEEVSYIVHLPGRSDCLVVDPGLEPELILERLEQEELTPAMILNTHGHGDHIGGNAALKAAYPEAPLVIGEGDVPMLTDPAKNLGSMAGVRLTSPPADQTVREGDTISAAGINLEILEIPGHTPGHVVFVCSESAPPTVFGGDVLFAGGIGRFDLPGGNGPQLLTGIRNKLFALPDDTVVYPGHGPATTIGEERRTNPFVGEAAGYFGLR